MKRPVVFTALALAACAIDYGKLGLETEIPTLDQLIGQVAASKALGGGYSSTGSSSL